MGDLLYHFQFLSKNVYFLHFSPAFLIVDARRFTGDEVALLAFPFRLDRSGIWWNTSKQEAFLFPLFLMHKLTRQVKQWIVAWVILNSLSFASAQAQHTIYFGGQFLILFGTSSAETSLSFTWPRLGYSFSFAFFPLEVNLPVLELM